MALYLARPSAGLYFAGVLVSVIGESIRVWAAGHLVKDAVLTRSGPYRWTRNPLYLGSLFVGLGFALAAGRPVLIVAVGVLFVLIYIPVMKREGRRLGERYVEDYADFAARVPLFWPRCPGGEKDTGGFTWSRVFCNREHWTVVGLVLVALTFGAKLFFL